MELFPERLVSDLARLPGGNHAFLKQICGPDGVELRSRIQRVATGVGPLFETRAAELLGSLDNRRFFQGFAEIATVKMLQDAGWGLTALHPPAPRFVLRSPRGQPVILSVLSFLHQTRQGGEAESRRLLAEALRRVQAKSRFVVLIRRWLPHDFDPEPVRRAVDLWLRRFAKEGGGDRYATYDDDHVSLEFCVTGERTRGTQTPLVLVMGPHLAHRSLAAVEPRIVRELDQHNASALRDRPTLIACVSDQPWSFTAGYLRDFLYGRVYETVTGPEGRTETFGAQGSVALFRDPLYARALGVVFIDRTAADAAHVRAVAWSNPWASHRIEARDLGVRCFVDPTPRRAREGVSRTMRWVDLPERVELG